MGRNFVVISGCSGGGKSTLLNALAARGFQTVQEPGRRIVAEQVANGGTALPWVDLAAFLHLAIDVALADRQAVASESGWVFFDRGLVDAASALEAIKGGNVLESLCSAHGYHRRVFMAPPWPEIFANDEERRHSLNDAIAEYERLMRDYPRLGYDVVVLPMGPVDQRVDFMLETLTASGSN
ncbi:AAA family ATPase [Mesorhizobium sp. GR13]|uniref:AAA family ATPase n=1 Tax=Mesorhizobium sp. GR13 TaxID=2562308 RepID=UPI0010BFF08D|nr:AAA family ATPase [Mesorhizobium sp. GR13]